MDLSDLITILIIVIIFLVIIHFIDKRFNEKHEIEILNSLEKQSPKKIKAQAKYKKESMRKKSNIIKKLINYFKILFTFF